jgi:hypothetical protein
VRPGCGHRTAAYRHPSRTESALLLIQMREDHPNFAASISWFPPPYLIRATTSSEGQEPTGYLSTSPKHALAAIRIPTGRAPASIYRTGLIIKTMAGTEQAVAVQAACKRCGDSVEIDL